MTYDEHRRTLIEYLKAKVDVSDWHGVSDAANDLRVLEAAPRIGLSAEERNRVAFDRIAERMAYEERRPPDSRFQASRTVYAEDLAPSPWWKRLLRWLRITH